MGLSQTASMEHGAIKLSWHEVVLAVRASTAQDASVFQETLHERVRALCPEHYQKIGDWQHLRNLVTRVDEQVWTVLEEFMASHDMQALAPLTGTRIIITHCHMLVPVFAVFPCW
jgi:hypothetical protein